MHIIQCDNINQAVYTALQKITKEGTRMPSRNGDILALYDVSFLLSDPRSIHLNLKGRTNNIYATIAEMLWVMSGRDDINPYLSFFIPRAPLYSDDGNTWRAAYGERIFAHGQLQNVIDMFKEDGIFTRRAVMTLLMPDRDTKDSLKEKYQLDSTKDLPCNNWLNFYITPDKKLNLKVTQRSGDIIFGTGNINLPEFSFLMQFVVQILQEEVDKDITLGEYHHSVTNLHLYDFNGKQGYNILKNEHDQVLGRKNFDTIVFPKSVDVVQDFFSEVVEYISECIESEDYEFSRYIEMVSEIFNNYEVPIENNLLFGYVLVVGAFVFNKKNNEVYLDLGDYSDEFTEAIKNNYFTTPGFKFQGIEDETN